MSYEVSGERALVASTSDAATALVLAREWLREPEQAARYVHVRRADPLRR